MPMIVPRELDAYLEDPDAAGPARAMRALLEMGKLDLDPLLRAYGGHE
jgi:hypothetical protein